MINKNKMKIICFFIIIVYLKKQTIGKTDIKIEIKNRNTHKIIFKKRRRVGKKEQFKLKNKERKIKLKSK